MNGLALIADWARASYVEVTETMIKANGLDAEAS